MKLLGVISFSIVILVTSAHAQVSVDLSGMGVKVQTGNVKGGSVATNSAGTIDQDVQMDGVAVINGEVFVDGEKVPKGKSPYISKKSGKTYAINWGKDGNVAIHEK